MLLDEAWLPGRPVRHPQFVRWRVYLRNVRPLCVHLGILCLWAGVVAVPAAARPADEPAIKPGAIAPKVVCATHPEQSYALYLPSAYTPKKRWPIIYIFDPVARGMVPTQIIKDAAEQYGYILATSNNSKNGPWKPEA